MYYQEQKEQKEVLSSAWNRTCNQKKYLIDSSSLLFSFQQQGFFLLLLIVLLSILSMAGFSQPINDAQVNAITLSDLDNWCSNPLEYSNSGATPDVVTGSCWQNNSGTGHNNVWFRFQATSPNITIKVLTESTSGGMRAQQMALLDETNMEVACSVAMDWYYGELSISQQGLVVGAWYYIMVDSRRADGSFTLCINDELNNDYQIAADTLNDLNGWCSGPNIHTNLSATSDQSAGSCWQDNGGTGNKNVWFIFQATTAQIKIDISSLPGTGNIKGQQYTLYDASLNELRCVVTSDHYVGGAQSTYTGLTIGDWYYIAVDSRRVDGYFDICVDEQPGYDNQEGAIVIPNISNYCSGLTEFNNWLATPDYSPGSCWQDNGGTGNKNVWFKFQATTIYANINVITSSNPANLRSQQFSLYDSSLNELECIVTPDFYYGEAEITYKGLTIGEWYYIAVDARRTDGYFGLCINDQPNYDCIDGAIVIPNISNYCSGITSHTNLVATPDQSPASCWQDNGGTGNSNVWFTFQATTPTVSIDVVTANGQWNMRGQQYVLYDAALNELECMLPPDYYFGNAEMTYFGLTVGDWYYIAVDSRRDDGYFEICIDDQPGFDFKEGAIVVPNINNYCSGITTYTNLVATEDQQPGSCWEDDGGTGTNNVWFTFQATSTEIVSIDVITQNGSWNMRGQQYVLYDAALNELECMLPPDYYFGNAEMTYFGLTAGDWYYIAVDSRRDNGYFEICIDEQPGFDFKDGAIEIPNISNYCSGITSYTNLVATSDQTAGSCWEDNGGTGNDNVWFTFQASTPAVTVDIFTENGPWNMRGQQGALFDTNLNELECMLPPDWYFGNAEMTYFGLTPGDRYYIAVDSRRDNGYFEICVKDHLGFDFMEGAIDLTDTVDYCSGGNKFTNITATTDRSAGSCWEDDGGTGTKNVWFKFQALSNSAILNVITETGSWKMNGQQYSVYNDTLAEIECVSTPDYFVGEAETSLCNLTVGKWYYIAVDSRRDDGYFEICLKQPPTLYSNFAIVTASCGAAVGSALANINGGTPPYSYVWDNGSGSLNIANLVPGSYLFTVVDSLSCTRIDTAIVPGTPPIAITTTSTNSSCGGADGTATAVSSASPQNYTYYWDVNAANQTTPMATGLANGVYQVTVSDNFSCSSVYATTVSSGVGSNVSGLATNNNCYGSAEGTILINENGASGLSYAWNNGQSTKDIYNLQSGSYTVTVSDATNCSTTLSFLVTEPTALSNLGFSITSANCGSYDGSATPVILGGTSPYTFAWNTGETTLSIAGLQVGDYMLTTTDALGCVRIDTAEIIGNPAVGANVNTTNETCNQSNGTLDVVPYAGGGSYTYSWGGAFNSYSSPTLTGLAAGTYFATITDVNSCTTTITGSVSSVGNEPVLVGSSTDVSCLGISNGAIDISETSGLSNLTYTWSNGAATEDLTGLSPGPYTITVSESTGCVDQLSFTISEPLSSMNLGFQVDSSYCGQTNGSIISIVAGGTAPYTYSWNTGDTTLYLAGFQSGDYVLTITDDLGCMKIDTAYIPGTEAVNANITTTNTTCGEPNGIATVLPYSGGGNYVFDWGSSAGNQVTQSASGLQAGAYAVTVTDINGCSSVIATSVMNVGSIPTLTATSIDVSCNGFSNGEIDLSETTGLNSLSYTWSNGSITEDLIGLSTGVYTVTAIEATGCENALTIVINEPLALDIVGFVIDSSLCGLANGNVSAAFSGGTLPYSYSWSSGDTSQNISGLQEGSYVLTTTDAAGCTRVDTAVVLGTLPVNGSITVTDATCGYPDGTATVLPTAGGGNFSYDWGTISGGQTGATATGLLAGSYTVTITDINSCSAAVSTTIANGTMLITSILTTITCNGYANATVDVSVSGGGNSISYLWNTGATTQDIDSLPPGIYSVTVSDTSGCVNTHVVSLFEPKPIDVSPSVLVSGCSGSTSGTINIHVTGGTPPYSYLWSDASTSLTITGLTDTSYVVTVTDANNCFNIQTISVSSPQDLEATGAIISSSVNLNDGAIDLTASGGTLPYSYSWTGPNNFTSTQEDLIDLEQGQYEVTITDNNGCTHSTSFQLLISSVSSVGNLYGYQIFPNPNNGSFNVVIDSRAEQRFTLELQNMIGQVIYGEQILVNNKLTKNISLPLTSGIYHLTLTHKGIKTTEKIVIR